MAGCFVMGVILDLTNAGTMLPVYVLMFGGGITWAVYMVTFSWSRCPQCNKLFFIGRRFGLPFGNAFTSRCMNCGIALKSQGAEKVSG